MRAMEELVKHGEINYIGVSNFSVNQLKEAQESLSSQEIVTNQVKFSILKLEKSRKIYPLLQITEDYRSCLFSYQGVGHKEGK